MGNENLNESLVKIWEKSVDVQMHFNDLIMRNRTIVISFVTAIFGAAAYSLKDATIVLQICTKQIHISTLIILFGVFFLIAYAYLDICYYLRLLVGSVKFTEDLDNKYKELGLTTKISKEIGHKRAKEVLRNHYLILLIGAFSVFVLLLLCL